MYIYIHDTHLGTPAKKFTRVIKWQPKDSCSRRFIGLPRPSPANPIFDITSSPRITCLRSNVDKTTKTPITNNADKQINVDQKRRDQSMLQNTNNLTQAVYVSNPKLHPFVLTERCFIVYCTLLKKETTCTTRSVWYTSTPQQQYIDCQLAADRIITQSITRDHLILLLLSDDDTCKYTHVKEEEGSRDWYTEYLPPITLIYTKT